MPTGSHRRQKAPLNKRTQFTDSTGWTHITKGGRAASSASKNEEALAKGIQALQLSQTSTTSTTTLDELTKTQTHFNKQWQESTCHAQLTDLIGSKIIPSKLQITKCVCLGLGSLSDSRPASKYQLAALISILDILQFCQNHQKATNTDASDTSDASSPSDNPSVNGIDVIMQDPAFTPTDELFLQSLSHTHPHHSFRVVTHPSAFPEINASTFLFAPHLEHWILDEALRSAAQCSTDHWPALAVANSDLRAEDRLSPSSNKTPMDEEKVSETLDAFAKARRSVPMPVFERDMWWHFTSVYWRDDGVSTSDRDDDGEEEEVQEGEEEEKGKHVEHTLQVGR